MRQILAPLAAVLALAACATGSYRYEWSELRSNPREFFNLNAPVRSADASIAGTTVVLKQGEALIVRLPEDAASGMTWRMRPLPRGAVVASAQHDFTAVAGADPAKPGGAGEATFRLRGIAPGTQAIAIDYVRPGFVAPEKSLAFDVAVR